MVTDVISTVIIHLLVCSAFIAATRFHDERFDLETDPDVVGDFSPDTESVSPVQTNNDRPLTLEDVLNQRVKSKSELCSRENVMMFFKTTNLEYIRDCSRSAVTNSNRIKPVSTQDSTKASSEEARTPVMMSYSGRLLKRILQNMGDGTSKIDFTRYSGNDRESTADKRSRLSINGALSSLVDMLRYETQGHSAPKYAFHRDLLHMG